MDNQPANPFSGGLSIKPTGGSPTIWQFGVAAVVLYLVMRHVPHGVEIGVIILFGVFLSTPGAAGQVANALQFIEKPFG